MTAPTSTAVRENECFLFDGFELDVAAYELRCDGLCIPMEPQVFEVLALLVQNNERVLTKDEILDAVWPERYVTEAVLNSRIMSARKALGDDGRAQRYIKTVHGRGYRFVGQVRRVSAGTPHVSAEPQRSSADPANQRGHALPGHATTFVGREREVDSIARLLTEEQQRLVTILGPGGIGKTRLAIVAASRLLDAGVPLVYVSLEPVIDAETVPGAIAAALNFKPSSDDLRQELVRHLSNTELVLVLDNFEQLVAGAAPFLSELLANAPSVRLLVTSRTVLGLVEEWVFRLEGLDVGDAAASPAVQLFLDRARQANAAAPAPTEAELETITQITRDLGGMPLAIELAASLAPYLPCGELLDLIRRDTSSLATDARNAPPRHRSIEALLAESCRQLDASECTALDSLSVFDGPFSASAAGNVAGASLLLLRRLVDKSLVQPVDGRFDLHPLMRQHARERAGGRLEGLRRAHSEHYAAFLCSRRPMLEAGGQVDALDEIAAEFANVNAAWRWAAASGRADLIAMSGYPLMCFLTFRGRFFEAAEMSAVAIPTLERAGDAYRSSLAALLMHHFWSLSRLGRTREALMTLSRVNDLFAAGAELQPGFGLDPMMAVAALQLGAGSYRDSATAALTALERARERDDLPAEAFASWLAGAAKNRQVTLEWADVGDGRMGYNLAAEQENPGAFDDAARLISRATDILDGAGEIWLRAYVAIEQGLIAKAFGDIAAAEVHFRRALELRRAIGDPQGTASAMVYLMDTLVDETNLDGVIALHDEVTELVTRIGDAQGVTESMRIAGRVALLRRDFVDATAHFRRCFEASLAIGFTNNVLPALRGFARVLQLTGNLPAAAVLHTFVCGHGATTPYSNATSEYDLREISAEIGEDAMASAREHAATLDVASAATFALSAIESTIGVTGSAPSEIVSLPARRMGVA